MPEYDAARYNPPAPVAHVTLRNPQTSVEIADQSLLIDTGADATLIPQVALAPLGLQPKMAGDCPDFAESSEQNGTVPFPRPFCYTL